MSSEKSPPRRLTKRKRTAPPPHDTLVVVFVAASGIFALITLSPFLFGHFPSHDSHMASKWIHRSEDSIAKLLDLYLSNATSIDSNNEKYKHDSMSLARGVSGLPLSQTPSLIGAKHATITCPSLDVTGETVQMDELAYWNDPQGTLDINFISPFALTGMERKSYVTFEPDRGGWNNIRMSLEIIFVFAAATGRTLVMPPDTPFYLLGIQEGDKGSKHHKFADFFNLENEGLRKKVEIITMKEFLIRESSVDTIDEQKLFSIPSGTRGEKLFDSSEYCYYISKSHRSCDNIYGFLRDVAYVPKLQAARDCLIFDTPSMHVKMTDMLATDKELFDSLSTEKRRRVEDFCHERKPMFYGGEVASAPHIHFHSGDKYHRLLSHFYTFLLFTDTKVDHHYKRFVRDFLHYSDPIFCAAGRIVHLLEEEASMQAASIGNINNKPGYSALHVRRGDFQYKKVKISAEEWLNATKDVLQPEEIVYVATDENNRSFFEPLQKYYNLRFLDEFSEAAGLKALDPNYFGMIDTIVASRGRIFFGTWFSTFSGYIVSNNVVKYLAIDFKKTSNSCIILKKNRMRGYNGRPGNTSFYGQTKHKLSTHQWEIPNKGLTAREWPQGWVGIDGDVLVMHELA